MLTTGFPSKRRRINCCYERLTNTNRRIMLPSVPGDVVGLPESETGVSGMPNWVASSLSLLIMKTRKTNGTVIQCLKLVRRKHQAPTSIRPGALQPKREVQAIHFN